MSQPVGELLFFLTAYPWMLTCFLLILSLVLLRTMVGSQWQFVAERYFAWLLLRDIDSILASRKPQHESEVRQSRALRQVHQFYWGRYDASDPDRVLTLEEILYALEGSGVKVPPRVGATCDEAFPSERRGRLSL
jgi:hypothetical protein